MGGIARKHRMTALQVGGIEDHIHALVTAPPTLAPCQIAQLLKGEASKWIHAEFHNLKRFCLAGWLRCFQCQPVRHSRCYSLYPESA